MLQVCVVVIICLFILVQSQRLLHFLSCARRAAFVRFFFSPQYLQAGAWYPAIDLLPERVALGLVLCMISTISLCVFLKPMVILSGMGSLFLYKRFSSSMITTAELAQ